MTDWLKLFVRSFELNPDSDCTPRIGIVVFNGPPIGCTSATVNAACQQFYPYTEWVTALVDEPVAEEQTLIRAIDARQQARDMTCISCGLEVGASLLRKFRRDGALPGLLILLTDGRQTAGGTDQKAIF